VRGSGGWTEGTKVKSSTEVTSVRRMSSTLDRSSTPRSTNPEIQRLHRAIAKTVELLGEVNKAVLDGYYAQKDVSTIVTGLEILYQRLLGQLKVLAT
jgi:hypothetical protein